MVSSGRKLLLLIITPQPRRRTAVLPVIVYRNTYTYPTPRSRHTDLSDPVIPSVGIAVPALYLLKGWGVLTPFV